MSNKILRVEKHMIKRSHKMYKIIDEYCYKSKNLYNFSNYVVRNSFINSNEYIDYYTLAKQIKHEGVFKDIGSNSGQHTLKLLHQNWKSYFAAIKDWSKNPNKYLGKPNIPNYLPKDGRYVWVLTNWQSKIINHELIFSFKPLKKYNGIIKTKVQGKHMQTRFIPKGNHYVMEIVYELPTTSYRENNRNIIGIDLGLNNFATVHNNFKEKPFVISGKKLKAINNFYNKQVSKYTSIVQMVNNKKWSHRLERLTSKRNNKVENFLHHASKYIVNYCVALEVDIVVIGYNSKWKQELKLGSTTQHFIYIPYHKFIQKLEYKLHNQGIKLIQTEESYTSKASFLDSDEMKGGVEFSGKRIHRGLYRSKEGRLINADVNGAGNIIRKVYPNAFDDGLKGVDLHPVIISVI